MSDVERIAKDIWKPTIAVDFDGVIHSYTSKWVAADVIPDPPVLGAVEWLLEVRKEFKVVIFTTRGESEKGRTAVREWLWHQGLDLLAPDVDAVNDFEAWLVDLGITNVKPPAIVYLDDRALCFEGTFPTVSDLQAFKTWMRK